jgi:hypothetical protein
MGTTGTSGAQLNKSGNYTYSARLTQIKKACIRCLMAWYRR